MKNPFPSSAFDQLDFDQAAAALELTKRDFRAMALAPDNRYGLKPDHNSSRFADCRWSRSQLEKYLGKPLTNIPGDPLHHILSPYSGNIAKVSGILAESPNISERDVREIRALMTNLCEQLSALNQISLAEKRKFEELASNLRKSKVHKPEHDLPF